MSVYPVLTELLAKLNSGLTLPNPVVAYADITQVSIQGTPTVCVVAEDSPVVQTIQNVRSITALRFRQEWEVVAILKDPSDQGVTETLLASLGELQYQVLKLLCGTFASVGGPVQILEVSKPVPIKGGAIAGRIRIGVQFVLNVE